jgi:site-specific recombinase XerD
LRSRHYSWRTEQAYLLEAGSDIRSIQELLGRTDVSKTMISTPVLTKGGHGVRSPGDAL